VFSLDTGEPQESNIFENVSPGNHVVSVTDLNGCGFDDAQINVFGLPQFFSPNGDGINETWNIELDPSNPMTVTIFVFDRFGKLLAQVFPGGTGWDGTFGGKSLPSDDYWFSVTVEETGEVTTGHFTLIR